MTAFAPASLSNLGPGFDALGLAITGRGDRVTAVRTPQPGVVVTAVTGVDADRVPREGHLNTAGRAAAWVLKASGATGGLALTIDKGIPLGSGIGGSAASAVAGALAANAALGAGVDRAGLRSAALDGEAAASGAAHGDNVLPCLLGGLVLVDPADAAQARSVALPPMPPMPVVVPATAVLTRAARAVLPESVSLADASAQAAALAFLLAALADGDWAAAGARLQTDRLAEPYRAPLVPVYGAVRRAALGAGAAGVCLSGSGPAMMALPGSEAGADAILAAMAEAAGPGALAWLARVDTRGARLQP